MSTYVQISLLWDYPETARIPPKFFRKLCDTFDCDVSSFNACFFLTAQDTISQFYVQL